MNMLRKRLSTSTADIPSRGRREAYVYLHYLSGSEYMVLLCLGIDVVSQKFLFPTKILAFVRVQHELDHFL